jgi:hypothetical protein
MDTNDVPASLETIAGVAICMLSGCDPDGVAIETRATNMHEAFALGKERTWPTSSIVGVCTTSRR